MATQAKSLYLDFAKLPRVDKRFTLGKLLANGICARIYQAVDHENGDKQVAIKVLDKLNDNIEVIEEEYRIFKDLARHENFPDFFGAFLNKYDKDDMDELWLVMEYCAGGSVSDLVTNMVKNGQKLTENQIGYIIKNVTCAIQYLHMNHIVHRDVKARNVLLTADGRVKLADFGFSRHLKHTMDYRQTSIGSPHWMAPEVISSRPREEDEDEDVLQDPENPIGYDNHCDVWSLGITAIEMADGEPPLWNIHPVRALFQIVHNPPPELKKPLDWGSNFRDFVTECLTKNPEHRPVAMEIVEHPFFQELSEDTETLRKQIVEIIKTQPKTINLETPVEMIARNGYIKTDLNGTFKKMYPDDLAGIEEIEEDKVLVVLGNRFSRGNHMTYVGDVLLIINPQQESKLYDMEYHDRYTLKARSDEEPHIFAVADRAWQDMLHHKVHQNIILSGDRNSGKSFNFTQIIRHMCIANKGNPAASTRIEQLPFLLDAFGNAAADGNSNSSRHCRYIELCFTESGKLCGAIIFMYLLEKWRICDALSKSNRNFHIFYYVYYGLKKENQLKKYHLDGVSNFRFLPLGETDAEAAFYLAGYKKLKDVLRDWDMEKDETDFIYDTIAAIILIGQIEFDGNNGAAVSNPNVLQKVAGLLNVNQAKLGWALCNTDPAGSGQTYDNTVTQAEDARDALARGLYSRLVDWLTNSLNTTMCLGRKVFGEKYSIGVLDPPGFDTANRKNSFEQLIANITNEQLAYHYCQSIFVSELQDCKEEGIKSTRFEYDDNRETMNAMLAKPEGLLSIIDEHSRNSSHIGQLADSLKRAIPQFVTLDEPDSFVVTHFGGNVRYKTETFFEKNRDYLPVELIDVMRRSSNPRLTAIFTNKMTKTGHVITTDTGPPPKKNEKTKSKGFNTPSAGQYSQRREMQTLAMQTRHTLIQLLQKMARGDPHFVRCFRRGTPPSSPGIDKQALADQIRAFNVLETIRIRQIGYTHRIPFVEFLRRYQFLAFDFEETVEMTGENCRLLLLRLKIEGWMLGKSKVFLKYYAEEYLSRMYEEQVRKIVKIQAVLRAVMAKLHKKRGTLGQPIQPRKKAARNSSNMSKDEAATAIQSGFRGYQTRKEMGKCPPKVHKGKSAGGRGGPPPPPNKNYGGNNYGGNNRGGGGNNRSGGPAKTQRKPMTEKDAAIIIQYFYRKWRKSSVFQQLMFCRAEKQQQLTYFCQQVHIYNQEFAGYARKSGQEKVSKARVTVEDRRPFELPRSKANRKVAAVIMKNRHFVDTTFMCVTPFDRSKLNNVNSNRGGENLVKPSNFAKNQSSFASRDAPPVAKYEYKKYEPNKPSNYGGGSVQSRATEFNGKPSQPSYGLAKPVAPKTAGYSAPVKSSAGPANIAREIEQKAAEFGKNDNDEAPFNFQGMLRKTNVNRGSMKRPTSIGGEVPSYVKNNGNSNNSNTTSGSSVVYNSKKSIKKTAAPPPPGMTPLSPNQHEIAPGLVLEGEEAEL